MSSSQGNRQRVSALKPRLLIALVCLLSVMAALPHASQANLQSALTQNTGFKEQARDFIPGEILVRFRNLEVAKRKVGTLSKLQAEGREIAVSVEQFAGSDIVEGLRLARVAPEDTLKATEALNAQADVLYAEPNYIRRKDAAPNDPRYAEQWALKNTVPTGADIDAEQIWDTTTGSRNVVVGVVDEGIDINHPDLRENIWRNPAETPANNLDDDGNGFVDDVNGYDFFHQDASVYDGNAGDSYTDAHGTHVAGTIGAHSNNGEGVAGVNWQVSLMSLKILGREDENPAPGSVLTTVQAYSYAKMMRDTWVSSGGARGANLRVLNNSYGGFGHSQAELDAILALGQSGILFVASAGNDSSDNDRLAHYPSNHNTPNMISVASSGRSDVLSPFSNYGRRSVSMAAPGQEILSTTPNGTYTVASGTSMASPHVAGAAALLLAVKPDVSVERLRAAIIYSGDELYDGGTKIITGRRLNAANALQNLNETDTTPPGAINDLRIFDQNNRNLTLQWTEPGDDATSGAVSVYQMRFSDSAIQNEAQFEQARPLLMPRPSLAGRTETAFLTIPYRHTSIFVAVRAIDNVGNTGPISSINVSIPLEPADPFIVTQSSASSLTTGGTPLGLIGDDKYKTFNLPFAFPYPGQYPNMFSVTVSTNGALYFGSPLPGTNPPVFPNGDAADMFSSVEALSTHSMIAGLWDDLRTDRRTGDDVYITSDPSRIVFRWQAVTYNTPLGTGTTRGENPVNFEIELRRDGTIITRYGDGNHNLFPVVGVAIAEPDAYAISSHTSEIALKDLAFAPTVSFARRNPAPLPSPDLQLNMNTAPNPVATGERLSYVIEARNLTYNGPAEQTVVNNQLPPGVTFVSCSATQGTCSGPPVGSSGVVTANLGTLTNGASATVTIVVQVTAPAGATVSNTASVSSYWSDPNTANNSVTATTDVAQLSTFGNVRAVAAGTYHTLALKNDGTVWAWGRNGNGQLGNNSTNAVSPTQVNGLTGAAAIAAGTEFSIALKSDGTVWAWGSNYYGQLGNGDESPFDKRTPVQVSGLTNVQAISAGGAFGLALKTDGTVWTWGTGYLGDGTGYKTIRTPIQVNGMTGVISIAAGNGQALAVKADGTVWGWGGNGYGEAGAGISSINSPVQISVLTNIVSVSGGGGTSYALKADGTVWVWGNGYSGQRGNNNAFTSHPTPAQVNGLTGVAAIEGGGNHVLALKSNGTLWAWGANDGGRLGDGTTTNRATPVQVSGLAGVSTISAGEMHSVAVLSDGTVRAWGVNGDGQLGDGTKLNRNLPVQVSGFAVVDAPTISPAGGSFNSIQSVTVNCATANATIHYTTNGVDPTESDPVIASGSAITVDRTMTLKAKAWKSGWSSSSISSASFTITGVSSLLQLIQEESDADPHPAAALDSFLFLRDPFPVINPANLLNQGPDKNTRVIVFVKNLQLAQGETPSSVIVNLAGSNAQIYDVAAEDVQLMPSFNFTKVVFRLPDSLAPGICTIKVRAHGQESNPATIRIKS